MNSSIGCSQLRAAAELPMSAPRVMPSSEASDPPTSMRFTVGKVRAARSPSASPSARLAHQLAPRCMLEDGDTVVPACAG